MYLATQGATIFCSPRNAFSINLVGFATIDLVADHKAPLDSSFYLHSRKQKFDLSEEETRKSMLEDIRLLTQLPSFSVLLGSGASHYLGSPNIRSFSRNSLDRLSEVEGEGLSAEAFSVLRVFASDLVDLEELLQKLTAVIDYMEILHLDAVNVNQYSISVNTAQQARAALNRFLVSICDLPASNCRKASLDPHLQFFLKLLAARAPDLPRIRVFTTNYDLVIEKALDEAGIHFIDGFRGSLIRRLDLNSYSSDFYRRPTMIRRSLMPIHEVVHLYKVHGSLNWRTKQVSRDLMSRGIVQSTAPVTDDSLAVVYPTPTKETDTLGYPYADLMRIFGATLSEPESALFVAGYGFRDEHLNRLIEQALAHNATMQLLIAEPFGVVKGIEADAPVHSESTLGRLSERGDLRIRVFTGEEAKFENLHKVLPDVQESNGITPQRTKNSTPKDS